MAEEVPTTQTPPQSEERGLFTLYGLFDKKKEEAEPEESLHDQPSEHHATDPPQADQPATHEIQVEEEERPPDEYKSMPHTDSETKPTHLDPTVVPPEAAAAAAVEEEEGGWHPTHIHEDDDAAAPAVEEEERRGDKIIPPATIHADTQSTQPADIYSTPTDSPHVAAAAVENSQGHSHSDEGQHFTREDEKQQITKGSSSSSASSSDEEEDDQKSEGEDDENKKEKEKKVAGKYPSAESGNGEKKEEKMYENQLPPHPIKKEGGAEEKKEGRMKKRSVKDKIKQTLAGGAHRTTSDIESAGEGEKKAGLLDRIKDKVPGHHAKE